jgi:hypothetical protein
MSAAVSCIPCSSAGQPSDDESGEVGRVMAHSLVACEDLEAADHLRQWNGGVAALPLVEILLAVKEDKEIVIGALEMHLELGSLAASHLDWLIEWLV